MTEVELPEPRLGETASPPRPDRQDRQARVSVKSLGTEPGHVKDVRMQDVAVRKVPD